MISIGVLELFNDVISKQLGYIIKLLFASIIFT